MPDDAEKTGSSDAELKARLDRLSAGINSGAADRAVERKDAASASAAQSTGRAMGVGFRVVSELVAGVLVGGGIGWGIDRLFGTAPFGLIVMLVVGMGAGFWNVYRLAARPTGTGTPGNGV
jgi:ATP synthase protein I